MRLYSELDEAVRGRHDNPDCVGRPHRGRGRLWPPTGRDQLDICPDEVEPPVPASERHRRPQISFLGVTGLFEPPAKSGERGRKSGGPRCSDLSYWLTAI
jgi:hypothetical protein